MPRQDRPPSIIKNKGGGAFRTGNGICASLLPEKVPHKLSFMESKFVIELMQQPQFDATKAAIAAGYKPTNAHMLARELLQRPRVREALDIQLHARSVRTGITVDLVVKELATIALADIRGMFNQDGSLKQINEMTREQASLVSSFDSEVMCEGSTAEGNPQFTHKLSKVKLYDRQRSLETLAKHLGMLTERYKIENKEEKTITHETVVKLDYSTLDKDKLEQLYAIASSIPKQGREQAKSIPSDTGTATRH